MLSKARQTKIQKIKHGSKILNFGASKPGRGELGSPGLAPASFSMYYAVQGVYRNRVSVCILHVWVVKYRTSENLTLGKSRMK